MKKIFITILVLVSVQMFSQTPEWMKRKIAERLNSNLTIDSFYKKLFTDSVFAYSNDAFICHTPDWYINHTGEVMPNNFGNFHSSIIGVYKNYVPRAEVVDWTGVDNKPASLSSISTVGGNILAIPNPASPSLVRINSNGSVVPRTAAEAKQDLGLENVSNESKATMFTNPAFTGTPTGIGIPVYARVTGSNATTTGQALVDIAGLSIPLAINSVYEISGMLSVSTSNVTTGVQYGLNYSVAGGTVEAQLSGSLTATATKTERISTLNTASTAYLTTSNQTGGIIIRGIITTGANAGNLTVKFLKVTSGTATVFQNSVLKVTRIQ